MMKALSTLIFLLAIHYCSLAQNHPYSPKFSHEIEKDLAEGNIYESRAALLSSLIGDYRASTSYSDIDVSWGVDSINFGGLSIQDALPFIVESASHHRIVIISENHSKPQHRIFALDLITELARIGYGHLGMETLSSYPDNSLADTMLHDRGYPLNHPITGTYTLEPQMGNVVREALKLDYRLFPYERTTRGGEKGREEIQADNISSYLSENPDAKIVILCGFHHAIESDLKKNSESQWMASYLKTKTGLDPLTIYQDNFTEKFINNEHPLLRRINVSAPSVFTDASGSLVSLTPHVDVEVVHPRTVYNNGRPNWMYRNGQRRAVEINKKEIVDYPVLVSAFPIGETNSVPMDRVELKYQNDNKVLVLSPGIYRIEIYDGANVTTIEQEVK